MLTRLMIQNIVLIQQVDLTFDHGLTVLTGETGAGKSILLDAIGLILGKRAEARLIRAGETQASVTAELTANPALQSWLEEHGLEVEDVLILRRRITSDGASKAFINDQPVTLKLLRELGDRLVTVHGQHGQKGLLETARHAALLDAYGQHDDLKKQVTEAYRAWRQALNTEQTLQEELANTEREQEYLEHMVKELAALNPLAGEEEELATRRSQLMQAEKTGRLLMDVSESLNGAQPVAETIRRAQTSLMRSSIAESDMGTHLIEGLERTLNELGEVESSLHVLLRDDLYDEQELERTEERLFSLREAARKHRVTVDELAQTLADATRKLEAITHGHEALTRAKEDVAKTQAAYQQHALALREARHHTIPRLVHALEAELGPLKMDATRFQVTMTPREAQHWTASGMDAIAFEVSTNPGSPFGALSEIASGGELSRFMLALAVVLQDPQALQMLIFDEIDTGTGGAVADAIGSRLARLAQHRQVAVVTHLPQVAARGDTHYFIEKTATDGHTTTGVTLLQERARHEELARMLSGASITDEARRAAGRLLEAAEVA